MRIGVVFPQTEITADPIAVRDYAQAAEALGYTHLLAFDHVVGADTTHYRDWRGPYTYRSLFHEPLVLFGYLAGLTQRLEFVAGILILPQRQTVLVAKQAAGGDPRQLGIEARVSIAGSTPEDWARAVSAWQELGATHLGVNTMNAGLTSPQAHIEAIRRFKEVVPAAAGQG